MNRCLRSSRREDRLEPFLVALAAVLALAGFIVLLTAGWVNAQTPADLQRQIDRLERSVDAVYARNIDWSARLAAVEREVELNRMVIGGLALPVIGQIIATLMLYRRLNGLQRREGNG